MEAAEERQGSQRREAGCRPWVRRKLGGRLVVPGVPLRAGETRVLGTVVQSWQARGGQAWVGRILPACVAVCALLALGGAIYAPLRSANQVGFVPSLLLGLLAILAGWLVWKIMGTVWLVGRTVDNELQCWATGRKWSLGRGEVLAVEGDAYGLFLVLVTGRGKIWLWAQMDDRPELLAAIRRSSPQVDIDHYAEPRQA
jgi:hypothetical protein